MKLQSCVTRSKVATLLIGLVVVTFAVYVSLGVVVFGRLRKNRTDAARSSWVGWYALVNATQPPVTGAIRHYKSLPDGQQSVTQRCQTCALVSSSGILLGKRAGKEIDSHSCVIRMNMAPVHGYQVDVGNRTTFRVLNFFMSRLDPETLPAGSQLMVWGLFRRRLHLERALNMTKRLAASGSTIYGQTVEGEREAGELFAKETNGQTLGRTQSWLSTGWFSLMVALDLCHNVHVYGMVPFDYCARTPERDVPYHYFTGAKGLECSTYKASETNRKGGHRFITEKAVFARWALRYNISFHSPDWTPDKNKLFGKFDTPFMNALG